MGPEPALSTIDRGCELGLYIIINASAAAAVLCCTLLYCCTTSWVGRLVRRWVGQAAGEALVIYTRVPGIMLLGSERDDDDGVQKDL